MSSVRFVGGIRLPIDVLLHNQALVDRYVLGVENEENSLALGTLFWLCDEDLSFEVY